MKKTLLGAFAALTFLFSIASCRTPRSGTSSEFAKEIPVLKDTRSEEKKMNTITTFNGDIVTYNMNTRKIVTTFGSQDVVAFGIKLLAYEGSTNITNYEKFYEGSTPLVNTAPISPEEILSFEPELILVNQNDTISSIRALSKIAPVIPIYTATDDFSLRLNYIGEIFGLQENAAPLIDYADRLKRDFKEKIDHLHVSDKTLTIFTYFGNGISIPPQRGWFMNVIIYDYLGIKRKENVDAFMRDESGIAYAAISSEALKDYEGEMVIYAGFGETTISSYVTENAGWKRLDSVRENRVGIIDITPYAQKGIILLYNQYDQIYQALMTAGK